VEINIPYPLYKSYNAPDNFDRRRCPPNRFDAVPLIPQRDCSINHQDIKKWFLIAFNYSFLNKSEKEKTKEGFVKVDFRSLKWGFGE
jgi:hypothetical protein